MMTCEGYCGDIQDHCNKTGAECDYIGGDCNTKTPYKGATSCEETTTHNTEATFSDCVNHTYETNSRNVGYVSYENTRRPVYSNLSKICDADRRDSTECAIISMMNFRRYYAERRKKQYENRLKWIFTIGLVLFLCTVIFMISF